MTDLEQVARGISEMLPRVKSGPLLLWGQPLGRPGEDAHFLIGCEAIRDCLRLRFRNDEVLALWNPTEIEINAERFRIGRATAMRFTYYFWDRPRLPENIFYRDYAIHDGLIVFRTNEDIVPGSGWLPESTIASFAAVEIID